MRSALCLILSAALSTPTSAATAQAMRLYDSFEDRLLDPARWEGGVSGRHLEVLTRIRGGRLHLLGRVYGEVGSNRGVNVVHVPLHFSRPEEVTHVRFTAILRRGTVGSCEANPDPVLSDIAFFGSFFNSGGGGRSAGEKNDVFAFIKLGRHALSASPDEASIGAFVQRCRNRECSRIERVAEHFLGLARTGEKVTLGLGWERDTNLFVFQRDDEPAVVSSYGFSDASPPRRPYKVFLADAHVSNCIGAERPMSLVEAFVDDVFVNESTTP